MMSYIKLSDYVFGYEFIYDKTIKYFEGFLSDGSQCDMIIPNSINDLSEYAKGKNGTEAFIEYYYLLNNMSTILLQYNCCFFHAAAFAVNGKCFLLTAPSGVGKSTQYRNLKQLYGEKVEILNGDKPILDFNNDQIMIKPSPWKGKESWFSMKEGQVDGVVYLNQDQTNIIEPVCPKELSALILKQFLYNPDSTDHIRSICSMADKLLRNTSFWIFRNKGDLESSELLYDTLMRYMEAEDE